ncbi:acyl-CoA thioesterase [Pseudogracilibacillus auburnensis]|uniref:acyl-CoA thioesterase n=1 Tax=Pseudogracilibacillus auburnensis TaxID=1494959 RepID=UPI001A9771E7|nr:thioesterase family protein [Pseudogracilibacillus auburnensis]MBO1004601.1 acyl-CoA thioesterase [Pseudogracilibacillus auburnensis]
MEINRTEIEVRYQETDQMGVVYHANYLVWFEIGRTKYIEQLGFTYTALEEIDVVSPVIDAQISYKKPIKYGDNVFVETWLEDYDGIRTTYGYKVTNGNDEIAVTGSTKHVVVQKDSFKPLLLRRIHPAWDQAYKRQVRGE